MENHQAVPADRVEEIRKTLGVKISDNLLYSEYVIVVEGPSDKAIIEHLLQEDQQLGQYIADATITVRSIGGVRNLKYEL